MFQQLFTGAFIWLNFGALIVGALLSFLLTSWRARLTWIDWAIVLLLNLPAALFLKDFLAEMIAGRCSMVCLVMSFGGAGFGLGLPFGLLCSKWVIAGTSNAET
jgi:hypothetical protein